MTWLKSILCRILRREQPEPQLSDSDRQRIFHQIEICCQLTGMIPPPPGLAISEVVKRMERAAEFAAQTASDLRDVAKLLPAERSEECLWMAAEQEMHVEDLRTALETIGSCLKGGVIQIAWAPEDYAPWWRPR